MQSVDCLLPLEHCDPLIVCNSGHVCMHTLSLCPCSPVYFLLFEYRGVESILDPLDTAATPGLLYLPRVIVRMEKLMEWTVLTGETEILGENLPRRHFVHHKSHLRDPGLRCGKPATNRFSYGVVCAVYLEAVLRADLLSKAFYKMSVNVILN
jgi:hypothetical protein